MDEPAEARPQPSRQLHSGSCSCVGDLCPPRGWLALDRATGTHPATSPWSDDDAVRQLLARHAGVIALTETTFDGAEDVTQEVFCRGARHVAGGGHVDVAWFKTVARHKIIDLWRARAREDRKLALAFSAEPSRVVGENRPAEAERVSQVLADLNPTYRAALVLRHLDGLSVPEVADLLDRSVEATEQVLSRARTAFRRAYAEAAGATNE